MRLLLPAFASHLEEPQPTEHTCKRAPRFRRWRDLAAFLLMVRGNARSEGYGTSSGVHPGLRILCAFHGRYRHWKSTKKRTVSVRRAYGPKPEEVFYARCTDICGNTHQNFTILGGSLKWCPRADYEPPQKTKLSIKNRHLIILL